MLLFRSRWRLALRICCRLRLGSGWLSSMSWRGRRPYARKGRRGRGDFLRHRHKFVGLLIVWPFAEARSGLRRQRWWRRGLLRRWRRWRGRWRRGWWRRWWRRGLVHRIFCNVPLIVVHVSEAPVVEHTHVNRGGVGTAVKRRLHLHRGQTMGLKLVSPC